MFVYIVLFFKQKTAYEVRISDWSSDVCSSDLLAGRAVDAELGAQFTRERFARDPDPRLDHHLVDRAVQLHPQVLDVGHAVGDVDHQQRVGSTVEADAAARGPEPPAPLASAPGPTTAAQPGQQRGREQVVNAG